jgi:hypothetical protein
MVFIVILGVGDKTNFKDYLSSIKKLVSNMYNEYPDQWSKPVWFFNGNGYTKLDSFIY